jgi:nucleotide-binding universal stress UspA family protein
MLSMHHILLPVAFSERCRGAACYAAAIGCHFNAQVTVIHSLESSAMATRGFEGVALPESWYVKQRGYMQHELERFFAEELRDVELKYVLVEGDPAREIVQYARADSVDLIVMPTHGYGPFRRFLLGSVTAKVLHDAACPVLTGPHMEQSPQRDAISFGTVLCAVDLAEQSAAVIDWGARFAESYGASLAIAHSIPMDEVRLGGIYFDERWREDAMQSARAKILELCQGGKPDGGIHFEFGEPAAAMGDVAERLGANLMVVGRSHAGGIAGRLRSTGYAIVREAPCSVLSV